MLGHKAYHETRADHPELFPATAFPCRTNSPALAPPCAAAPRPALACPTPALPSPGLTCDVCLNSLDDRASITSDKRSESSERWRAWFTTAFVGQASSFCVADLWLAGLVSPDRIADLEATGLISPDCKALPCQKDELFSSDCPGPPGESLPCQPDDPISSDRLASLGDDLACHEIGDDPLASESTEERGAHLPLADEETVGHTCTAIRACIRAGLHVCVLYAQGRE